MTRSFDRQISFASSISADGRQQPLLTWCDDAVVGKFLDLARQISDEPGRQITDDSTALWADPAQTLIFLDWDDTLFPTSYLNTWGVSWTSAMWRSFRGTKAQEDALERWRDALFLYLRTVCSLSEHVVIITNAQRGWVGECINRFAPNLGALFGQKNGPRVVYAHDELSDCRCLPGSSRGNPALNFGNKMLGEEFRDFHTRAKYIAMRREAEKCYSQYPEQTWKNIISVGDAEYEHDAAQELTFRRKSPKREHIRLKSIQTPAAPTITDMTYRLKLDTLLYPAYVCFDGEFDLDFRAPYRLEAVADALEMPELIAAMPTQPIPEGEKEQALTAMLDEVAIIVHNYINPL